VLLTLIISSIGFSIPRIIIGNKVRSISELVENKETSIYDIIAISAMILLTIILFYYVYYYC